MLGNKPANDDFEGFHVIDEKKMIRTLSLMPKV